MCEYDSPKYFLPCPNCEQEFYGTSCNAEGIFSDGRKLLHDFFHEVPSVKVPRKCGKSRKRFLYEF
jgi:hypothetical protein